MLFYRPPPAFKERMIAENTVGSGPDDVTAPRLAYSASARFWEDCADIFSCKSFCRYSPAVAVACKAGNKPQNASDHDSAGEHGYCSALHTRSPLVQRRSTAPKSKG
ncbi:hypothetical protein [Limimaricola soesokkakensis]|uniref:hypothetical protein n=1 Tax=Limimaricola soesokkakensis TaxID=1343159 RepID=UPI0035149BD3